jgi:hypothetical protein
MDVLNVVGLVGFVLVAFVWIAVSLGPRRTAIACFVVSGVALMVAMVVPGFIPPGLHQSLIQVVIAVIALAAAAAFGVLGLTALAVGAVQGARRRRREAAGAGDQPDADPPARGSDRTEHSTSA